MNSFEQIEITDTSRPYGGLVMAAMMAGRPALDLEMHGYVEEEYILSGKAGGSVYRVPLLVRKPKDAGRFSGLVVTEPMHAAGVIPTWNSFQHIIMAEGHAWATVGMQRTAFEQWRSFDPERYADLTLPTIGERSWPVGRLHFSLRTPQDEISREIMTQFGAAVKNRRDDGPFVGWSVRHLIMSGNSQSSLFTLSYIRNANPAARLADGSPIWDGFLPVAAPTYGDISGHGSAVINVYGDGDIDLFAHMGGKLSLREDSDAPDDRYRTYEVPGASHAATRGYSDIQSLMPGDPNVSKLVAGPGQSLSQFPTAQIFAAVFRNLVEWVVNGTPPPRVGHLERKGNSLARDAVGNPLGGLRSPFLDMPRYRYITAGGSQQGIDLPALDRFGVQVDLPTDELKQAYPTRTDYLRAFDAAIDDMVRNRFLLPDDADVLKAEERGDPPF